MNGSGCSAGHGGTDSGGIPKNTADPGTGTGQISTRRQTAPDGCWAGDTKAREHLKEDLADLKEQKLTLLKAAGYPEDYMELRYDCPDCHETGYVNGKRCHCFERQRLNIL